MIEEVLFRLDLPDQCSCRLVRPQWYNILDRDLVLNFTLSRASLDQFRELQFTIDRLRVKVNEVLQDPFVLSQEDKDALSHVTSLSLEGSTEEPPERWTLIKRYFRGINTAEGLRTLYAACSQIRLLRINFQNVIGRLDLQNPMNVRETALNHLQTLQVQITYNQDPEMVLGLFGLKTPVLKVLEVERSGIRGKLTNMADREVYVGLLWFLVQNKESLRVLKLVNMLVNIVPRNRPANFPQGLLAELSNVNLTSLEIFSEERPWLTGLEPPGDEPYNQVEDWTFGDQLLESQASLQTVSIQTDSAKLLGKVYAVLDRNASGLRKLSLRVFGPPTTIIDCQCLRGLIRLRELRLDSMAHVLNAEWLPTSIEALYWNATLEDLPIRSKGTRSRFLPNLWRVILGLRPQALLNLEQLCDQLFAMPNMKHLSVIKSLMPVYARNQRMIRRSCLHLGTGNIYVKIDDKSFNIFKRVQISVMHSKNIL